MINKILLFGLGVCPPGMFDFHIQFGESVTYKHFFTHAKQKDAMWFIATYTKREDCPAFLIENLPFENIISNRQKNLLYIRKNWAEYVSGLNYPA